MMRKLLVLSALTMFVTVVAPGRASAAPEGDGGGLLGIPSLDTQTHIDDLFATGEAPPCVVVWVDCWTSLGGSQFLDSPGTGRYHTYLCD